MFTMNATIDPSGTPRTHLFFPNGFTFDALDVFLGAIMLHSIHVSINGAGTLLTPGVLTVYDGRLAATGRPGIGGTAATNLTTDAWRVIAAGAILTAQYGQPYVANLAAGGVSAQITTMRKIVDALTFNMTTGINEKLIEFPEPLRLDGAVIQFDTTVLTDPFTLVANFTPLVSGSTRRRLSYLPGSTVKRPNMQTTGSTIL